MRLLIIPMLAMFLFSCKKDEPGTPAPLPVHDPEIMCGTAWHLDCLDAYWVITKTSQASLTVLPQGYNGKNSLLLYNPHGPNEVNPQGLRLNAVIKNIKKDVPYMISFYAKIKGYPDALDNPPGLAAFVFADNDWYNQMYYGSKGGEYHDKDWSKYNFNIIGKETPTLNFELYSVYDSTWISDLKIEAL